MTGLLVMVPSFSAKAMFSDKVRQQMLQLARNSIRHGLDNGTALKVDPLDYDQALAKHMSCFVTLHLNGRLRGCIGSLEAHRPLIDDLCDNAFAAAFRDPRFAPLSKEEFESVELDISVLTPSTPMIFNDEQDLLGQLKPGQDGLILQEGHHRGTFLPSVWEQVPQPARFLQQLKQKAGLAADYWSDDIQISRYSTELIK